MSTKNAAEPARELTREELLKAQSRLCSERGWPHFAPTDGICYNCRKDMVGPEWETGLVTGCRHCCYSYCD